MRVGIVGGGQLARMLVLAGSPLGLEFSCQAQLGDPVASLSETVSLDSKEEWQDWLDGLDVLTFEHENVNFDLLTQLRGREKMQPNLQALLISSDRLLEKQFFSRFKLSCVNYHAVENFANLKEAVQRCGYPGYLKRRRFGFDGRGQFFIKTPETLWQVWQSCLDQGPFIYESLINFEREVSQLVCRNRSGQIRYYPLSENEHCQGILTSARCLAEGDPLEQEAQRLATILVNEIDYVGILAVEFFVFQGKLYINEIAPRVHNSGHWSIEASCCSQFENHLRAVCDLPLGSTKSRAAKMFNCLGKMPRVQDILAIEGAHYHDYCKSSRPQRKLGHITLLAETGEAETLQKYLS